jgi:hypothetical protein
MPIVDHPLDAVTLVWRRARLTALFPALLAVCLPGSCDAHAAGGGGPSYYVSPGGSDGNAGTLASPFRTLTKCQTAMAAQPLAPTKTCTLRAGIYALSRSLTLTSSDNGTTWQYYQPDGVDTAVLDGGNSLRGGMITTSGASNVTINGIKIQNFYDYGIKGSGCPGCTIENNDVGGNLVDGAATGFQSAAIVFGGDYPNLQIRNNFVHDTSSQGIALFDNYTSPSNMNGTVISGNVVLRAVQVVPDGAAIYVSMHGGTQGNAGVVLVKNNYVKDYGGAAVRAPGAGIGLDDNANNVWVQGNVIGPPGYAGTGNAGNTGGSNEGCFGAHNGHDNHYTGNLCDIGTTANAFIGLWYQDRDAISGMHGTVVTGNIVISSHTGRLRTNSTGQVGFAYFQNSVASDYKIRDNFYHNYAAGGSIATNGVLASDSNPVTGDPEISGWTYTIAAGSPVFDRPINFPPVIGGWGPPGFVIPQTGQPPSSPH